MKKKLSVMVVCMLLATAITVTVATAGTMTVTASQQRLPKDQIVFISKSNLEHVTGNILQTPEVSTFANHFSNSQVWVQLGFSGEEAERLAARAQQAPEQVLNAMSAIAEDESMQLKVLLPASGNVFIGYGTREGRIFDELPPDYDGNPIP